MKKEFKTPAGYPKFIKAEKKFNLCEKREELFLNLCNKEPENAGLIQTIQEVIEQQDKQFIKEILDEIDKNVDASDNGYSINTEIVKKIKDGVGGLGGVVV